MHRTRHHQWRPNGAYASGTAKRAVDLVLALVLSVLTVPVVLVLAGTSAIVFRAWPFFGQERLGRHGVPFRFLKIRSLPTSVPRYIDKRQLQEQASCRWGTFLRGTHLDELPQLWLVVAGRMSLVGPRPEMAKVAAHFDPTFVAVRTTVRPGCTGPWQVSTSYNQLIGSDTRFDLLYLDEATLRFDLRVLWWTVAQRLGGRAVSYERMCEVVGDPVVVRVGARIVDLRGPLLVDAVLGSHPRPMDGRAEPVPATID